MHDFIGSMEVKPQTQPKMKLGTFSAGRPFKGFLVEISPDPDPSGAVVSQIINMGNEKHHDFVLQLSNYGSKTVKAKVWQL